MAQPHCFHLELLLRTIPEFPEGLAKSSSRGMHCSSSRWGGARAQTSVSKFKNSLKRAPEDKAIGDERYRTEVRVLLPDEQMTLLAPPDHTRPLPEDPTED